MSADEFRNANNDLRYLTAKISWMRNHDSSGCLEIAYGKLLEIQREFDRVSNLYERTGWGR